MRASRWARPPSACSSTCTGSGALISTCRAGTAMRSRENSTCHPDPAKPRKASPASTCTFLRSDLPWEGRAPARPPALSATPSSSWCSTLPAGRLFHGVPGSIPAIGGCMPPCSSTPPHPKLRPMKTDFRTYLVGGAVRDQLLGVPWHERDWVVVGATPDQLLEAGFRPVGQDFPVFLHPDTGEEYALARTER